jgi:FKBP-type peptidyl-prolyl cis-trans isomerase SlyD
LAQPAGQKTFSSPDEASRALIRAVQSGNEEELLEIFGTDGKEIISSGDQVEDQKSRDTFAEKYQRMNRLVAEPDGTVRLYVGAENWPMPIPLVNRKNAWYFDTSAGKEPLTYIHGAGQIVKGLEQELNGLKVGDQKKVSVKPEDGYGMPSEKAFQEIPREKVPTEAQKEGATLMMKSPDGRAIPIKIAQVKEKTVVVDFNHPLAGKTLHFDVKVKDIQAADTK